MAQWCTPGNSWVWWMLVWAVVALVVLLVGRLFPGPRHRTAQSILDARLAAGDIDVETYHRMRAAIDRQTLPGDPSPIR